MALPKLVIGKSYVITGANDYFMELYKDYEIKFPQTVKYDGDFFFVESKQGIAVFEPKYFVYKEFERKAKVEIYKSRGAIRFRVKGANGKLLNHQYNDKRGCKRGIKALEAALRDYEIVDLTK